MSRTVRHAGDMLIQSMAIIVLALALASLAALLIDVIVDGAGRLNWQFLTSLPSRRAFTWKSTPRRTSSARSSRSTSPTLPEYPRSFGG